MRAQQRLRSELRFVSEFGALLDVTQHVAIAHLRRLDERLAREPALAGALLRDFIARLPLEAQAEPLVRGGTQGRLLVVITSDAGMVGRLHAQVVRRALEQSDAATRWVFVGQRGPRLVGDRVRDPQVVAMPEESDVPAFMRRLGQAVFAEYQRASLRDAWVVAPRYVSPTRQDVAASQLLPLPVPTVGDPSLAPLTVVEPSLRRVVEQLCALWIEHVCYEAFWSARRAECAARALHVESSRDALKRMTRQLRLEWFKTLHERIDVLVRETCVVRRHAVRCAPARTKSV